MSNKLLVVIGGPTGVGKTTTAIQLAAHYQTEIVNADSRQIYRELEIGVGRPDSGQLSAIPHHLIGHVSIFDTYSAGHYEKEALKVITHLFQYHDTVILTGGTGLYLKAVLEGLDDIPSPPEEVVHKWTSLWKEKGTPALLEALLELDPGYAAIVDQSNPMRLIRALAVTTSSGQPFSSFRKGDKAERTFHSLPIMLEIPRQELYNRIDQRVLDMIEAGWLAEAGHLHPHKQRKALQTVGYKELFQHIDGQMSLPEAIAAIQQATRRYAKRQMTWFRNQGIWQTFHPRDSQGMQHFVDSQREFI